MKKVMIASLLTLAFSASLFAQTKKEKIEELVSVSGKTSNKFLDGMDKMIDQQIANMDKKKKTAPKDSTIRPWVAGTVHPEDPQPFEDTAKYNKLLRAKAKYRKAMVDMMDAMKKESVPLYDSAFTEAQIDKQLTYYKSKAYKNFIKSSMDMFSKGSFLDPMEDTSYKSHVFNPKRKERLDSLVNLAMSRDLIKTTTKGMSGIMGSAVASQAKDSTQRKKMQQIADSTMQKISSDTGYAKLMDASLNKMKLRSEVNYDKNLGDDDITYLIAYYSDPEAKKIQQIQTELAMSVVQKIMPKFAAQMADVFKMK